MTNPTEPPLKSIDPSVKRLSRGWSNDMDGPSVARRLAVVDQLYQAWLVLKQARPLNEQVTGQAAAPTPSQPNA